MVTGAAVHSRPGRLSREFSGELPRLASTLGSSVLITVFGAVSGISLARGLGPAARGELAFLLVWPQLVSTLANVGVDLAVTYYSTDSKRSRNVPATALALALPQSVLGAGLYLTIWPFALDGPWVGLLPLLMAALVPVDLTALYLACALNGRHDVRAFNLLRMAMPALYAGAVALLLALGHLSVGAAAGAFVVANTVLAVAMLARVRSRHGLGRFDVRLARDLLGYGLRGHLGRLSPQGIGMDLLIIGLVLSTRDLGLFAAATALLAASRMLTTSSALVVFPEASSAHLHGGVPRVRGTIAAVTLATAALAAVLWLVATPLTTLVFGHDFGGAASILRLLAIGEVGLIAYVLLGEAIRGSGRPGLTTVAEAVNWTVFLAATTLGATFGGIEGVAAGLAASRLLMVGVFVLLAWKARALTPLLAAAAVPAVAGECR
ncbi:MAG: lipopolysaccharide biosynthesis protein [Gaiellaceae bacterium]